MERKLINALKELKPVIFLDNPMSKYSVHAILKSFSVVGYEGQKRITFDSPTGDTNYVYKVGTTDTGVRDNACEVAMYRSIEQLFKDKKINQDLFYLFPSSELVENDPFIIKNKRVLRPNQIQEFNDWVNRSYQVSGYSEVDMWANFIIQYKDPITQRNILWEDYINGQKLLASIGVISDVTMIEPLNFGAQLINGTLRLAFLDLGSCIPFLMPDLNKIVDGPVCPCCGNGTLSYMSFSIDPSVIPLNEIKYNYSGVYACNNPACSESYQGILEKMRTSTVSPMMRDSVVYDQFMTAILSNPQYYAKYNLMLMVHGGYYFPQLGMDKQNYYNSIMQIFTPFGLNTIDANLFNKMYENYTFKTLSTLIQSPDMPLNRLVNDPATGQSIMSGALPYSAFKGSVYNILATYGISSAAMACKISSILYLSIIINVLKSSGQSLNFYDFFDLDINSFLGLTQGVYSIIPNGQVEFQELHQHLKL